MKDEKLLLQLLRRTSDDDPPRSGSETDSPVLFVDLNELVVTDSIDVIVPLPVVVLPRVSERIYVPGPEEMQ